MKMKDYLPKSSSKMLIGFCWLLLTLKSDTEIRPFRLDVKIFKFPNKTAKLAEFRLCFPLPCLYPFFLETRAVKR
jgi:hypothetical protein